MFNRGKLNQGSCEETDWNGSSSRFQDPVEEQISCMRGKQRKKEFEVVSDPFSASHFTEFLQNDILSHSSGVFN